MTTPQAGDVGLSTGTGFIDWCIRFGESRRYGRGSREASVNHAFMVVDGSGGIIEAQGRGMVPATMTEYRTTAHLLIRPPYQDDGCVRAVAAMRDMCGSSYGYLEIACLGLAFLTQTKLRFGVAGEHICSGAVARALDRGGLDMGDDEEWDSPADVLRVALVGRWPVWTWDIPTAAYWDASL